MHVLTGLRAGVRCGSAHSGAPWTPPTARGMLKRVRRQAAPPATRAVLAHTCAVKWRRGANQGSTFSGQVTVLLP